MNALMRYIDETKKKGFGRMIEIESYNAAIHGLPDSLDAIYSKKAVDRICIFDCFAKNLVEEYKLVDGEWNNKKMPSVVVVESRQKQLENENMIDSFLTKAINSRNDIVDVELKSKFDCAFTTLYEIKKKHSIKQQTESGKWVKE